MKILFIIHAEFEKPGSIGAWAKKHNHQTQEVYPFKDEKLPDVTSYDFLVVMGGQQSPLHLEEAPYLADEIDFIKQALTKNKRIIGICLGAQLIGEALGATTEHSPHREIGVYPLTLLPAAKYDPVFSQLPEKFDVAHWHSDMPGIPKGAVLLAESEGCPRQIFSYGDRVYGFQCHFELTQELVSGMIDNCPEDLKSGKYVQSSKELTDADYPKINSIMDFILDYLSSLPELILNKDFFVKNSIGEK
jgi:GMP synthase (glutamine-hydrolysing)